MADIIKRKDPFVARVLHDGVDVTAFRLFVDGQLSQEKPASEFLNGGVDFTFANGLSQARSYAFSATAVNQDGESLPVNVTLVVLPKVPSQPATITFSKL